MLINWQNESNRGDQGERQERAVIEGIIDIGRLNKLKVSWSGLNKLAE